MITVSVAVQALDHDLRQLFGDRLKSVVAYGPLGAAPDAASTLAVVDRLTADDLRSCAWKTAGWAASGLATPLLLTEHEFGRALDAFPFEFGGIMANHVLVSGIDPFNGLSVSAADLRHACEVQARSHLLHLREGYMETEGRSDGVADLISRSAGALAALVRNIARLHGEPSDAIDAAVRAVETTSGVASGILGEVIALAESQPLSSDRARVLFPAYLEAVTHLVNYIDRWTVS